MRFNYYCIIIIISVDFEPKKVQINEHKQKPQIHNTVNWNRAHIGGVWSWSSGGRTGLWLCFRFSNLCFFFNICASNRTYLRNARMQIYVGSTTHFWPIRCCVCVCVRACASLHKNFKHLTSNAFFFFSLLLNRYKLSETEKKLCVFIVVSCWKWINRQTSIYWMRTNRLMRYDYDYMNVMGVLCVRRIDAYYNRSWVLCAH